MTVRGPYRGSGLYTVLGRAFLLSPWRGLRFAPPLRCLGPRYRCKHAYPQWGGGTSRKEHGFDLLLGLRSGDVLFAKALRRPSSSAPKAQAVEVRSLVIDQLKRLV